MAKHSTITKFLSYFFSFKGRKVESKYSGDLFISFEKGRKVLNTSYVNYSYNSLHRVFKNAFRKSGLGAHTIDQVLILGLGGGSILQILRRDYSIKSPIRVVEIDPQVIELAIGEFDINQYNPIEIIEADAFSYIQSNNSPYDLICVDVFINEKVPSQFLTTSFIERLLELTKKGGLIYFNIMLSNAGIVNEFNAIYQYLVQKKPIHINDVYYIEMEENNRVIVIKK